MNRDALRAFLQVGFMVGGCGFVMAFSQPPGSAEFVLSVCSSGIGLALVLGVVLVFRYSR